MANVVFITGNAHKAAYLAKYIGHPVDHTKIDLDEIQSLDLREIVSHKVRQAYAHIKKPVLVEDVSFECKALGKLPGPFIKWFLQELSFEGICRLLDGKDRSVIASCVFGYFDGEEEKYFGGRLEGVVPEHPRGEGGYGFDQILIPTGHTVSRAELNDEDYQATYLQMKPIEKVAEFLRSK